MKQPAKLWAKKCGKQKEKNSKTIEEGNTSQQAREHHFQENLGRPHTFIHNYILVQYLFVKSDLRKNKEQRRRPTEMGSRSEKA
uniref:Ovule protein n=1 Tax=Elaeophora elaphi TaxID=1147741 RepID=A0A0R3S193_9BILA